MLGDLERLTEDMSKQMGQTVALKNLAYNKKFYKNLFKTKAQLIRIILF